MARFYHLSRKKSTRAKFAIREKCAKISQMISKEDKAAAIASTQIHKNDVGSPAAQVAILTARINEITEHLRGAKHDFMARRGLLKLVGRRKKLLKTLEKKDYALYKNTIETHGLRK